MLRRLSLRSIIFLDAGPPLLLYLTCFLLLLLANSAGVTHWKVQEGTILPVEPQPHNTADSIASSNYLSDPEFAVLTRNSKSVKGSYQMCPPQAAGTNGQASNQQIGTCRDYPRVALRKPDGSNPVIKSSSTMPYATPLTCGEPVEFTVYDFLQGIARRKEHRPYPEPEVAMIFKKADSDTAVDLVEVELTLRKAYTETPESLTVLNQIGNYWRIKGNTQLAIECFRKALSISSDHPDLLLNLSRILFNLKYLEDAIFLAKRSLHMKSSEQQHTWLQHFTLGEVYKALEKYEEAAFYFKKTLELNPGLQVAEMHLREMGLDKQHSANLYTVLIILALILIVLLVIYYLIVAVSSDAPQGSSNLTKKSSAT